MNILRHVYMVIAEIVTLLLYAGSIVFLPEYFGMYFYSLSDGDGYLLHMALRRPVIRYLCAFCLEGGRHCGGQRFPVVCDKVH